MRDVECLVMGCGMVGSAIAMDLSVDSGLRVTVADVREEPLAEVARRFGVRTLRAELGLSLEALAAKCDVSRSMISLVERGESSPTAVVLEKISFGLGVPLASLFEDSAAPASPVSHATDRVPWKDPESGYVRCNISPANFPSPIQIVDVVLPAGARGPAFLVGPNVRAILRYNNSTSYALAVGLLAQRLTDGAGVQAAWPRDLPALSRSQLLELQTALNQRGFASGTPDGMLGPATRDGLRRYQRSIGVPADGYPTLELLQRLEPR